MDLGMVGLGRTGTGLTRRLLRGGHRGLAYDRLPEASKAVAGDGAGTVEDSGGGRRTVQEALDKNVPGAGHQPVHPSQTRT